MGLRKLIKIAGLDQFQRPSFDSSLEDVTAKVSPMAQNKLTHKPSEYYAVKKVFVKFFAKFFEVFAKFFKVFASFLRFSRAFRGFRIHSDPLGCIRMHSEAIGSVWTFSKFFEIFWIFESFFNVSGRNFYKRLFSRHNMLGSCSRKLPF